jgi:hypothetical protein
LADNGEVSLLPNERSYRAVRTDFFKQWFGDWEMAGTNANLRQVRGSDQARAAAREFLNQPLHNREGGITATVSGETLGKMMSRSAVEDSVSSQAHLMAVANLDRLFPLALKRETRPDREGSPTIEAIHHFEVPMLFDGDIRRVKMLVKEFSRAGQGARLYTVAAVEIEEARVNRGERGIASPVSVPPAGFEKRFAQLAASVKGVDVSKVVDSNGEPMIVYSAFISDVQIVEAGNQTVSSGTNQRQFPKPAINEAGTQPVSSAISKAATEKPNQLRR